MMDAEQKDHGHISQQSVESEFSSRAVGDPCRPPLHQTLPDDSQHQHQQQQQHGNGTDTDDDGSVGNSSERKRLFRSPSPSGTSRSLRRNVANDGSSARSTGGDGDEEEDVEPMLSILNVVVDHVMVPPSPLEPEEFDVFCRQRRKQLEEEEERKAIMTSEDQKCGDDLDLSAADEAGGYGGGGGMMDVDRPSMFPLSQQSVQSEQSASGSAAAAHTCTSQAFLQPPRERVLVPVLRFFGPIIRGDSATVRSTPRQSGCLHVHGAFPYMVARPVVAGPDGSSYRRPGDSSASSRIDWDDAISVSYIVDEIHAKLEAALRATDEWKERRDNMDGGEGVNGAANIAGVYNRDGGASDSQKLPVRYVRQVTVVTGKGFYTYCSGPPAPFLRVEYYDPKSKWKIKLMLERGLDVDEACKWPSSSLSLSLGREYIISPISSLLQYLLYNLLDHPDSRYYDYECRGDDAGNAGGDNDNNNDGGGEDGVGGMRQLCPPLKFRCFEAHIPYTMQVFKDLNLSGMSYIKLKSCMFRRSLPKKERKRVKSSSVGDGDSNGLFLEENIPGRYQWKLPQKVERRPLPTETQSAGDGLTSATSDTPSRYQQHAAGTFAGGLSQPEPSSTATPFDTTPTPTTSPTSSLPCQYSSSSLLPEDQFWTVKESLCDVEVDACCTDLLNIRDVMTSLPDDLDERARVHWRAVPSLREIWELERRRMASLLSKEDDFLNSPPDSEESKVAHTLDEKGGPSLPGARLALRGNHRLYDPSPGLEDDYRRALGDIVSRHADFLQRVDNAFKGDGPAVFSPGPQATGLGLSTLSSSQDEALAALNALGEQFGSSIEQMKLRSQVAQASQLSSLSPQTPNSRAGNGTFRSSPLHVSQVVPLTQADLEDIQEATTFGQSLERDESVFGDLTGESSSIGRFTMTPDDNEDDSDEDVFYEEEKLGEEGFSRSLSMLATQLPSSSDELAEEEYPPGIERQANDHQFGASAEGAASNFAASSGNHLMRQADRAIETICEEEDHSFSNDDEDEEERYHESNCDGDGGDRSDGSVVDNGCTLYQSSPEKFSTEMSCESGREDIVNSPFSQCTSLRRGKFILPQDSSLLPRRRECSPKKVKGWHAVHKVRGRPQPWLRLSAAYEKESGQEITPTTLFCSDRERNVFVEPLKRPPSSRQVSDWWSKIKRKNCAHKSATKDARKNRNALVIDDNTRKLVAASAPSTSQKRRRVAFANDVVQSSCQVFQVEEIPIENDCKSQMSQSPYQSQSSMLSFSQDDGNQADLSSSLQKGDSSNTHTTPPGSIRSHGSADSSHQTQGSSSGKAYSAFDPSFTMGHVDGMSPLSADALDGIGQQGGKIHVAGGGGLKGQANLANASHLPSAPTPLTIISIEVHVQCRTGKAGAHDSKTIAMRPDPSRDKVAACVYLFARDPGGGEAIEILERGVLFTPVEAEIVGQARENVDRFIRKSLGISMDRAKVEMLRNERQLLLRLASIVKYKDPDALMSWDTQGGGLGYLIERGAALAKGPAASSSGGAYEDSTSKRGKEIDMVKLLGRIIKKTTSSSSSPDEQQEGEQNNEWSGSGLGSDWDERVGAGAAAASIVSLGHSRRCRMTAMPTLNYVDLCFLTCLHFFWHR